MAPALASRTGLLKPSPTLAITAKAKALKASGRDIIALAAGEPDFNTPEAVCQAAEDAMRQGFTKYTPTVGIPELRQAVCDKALRENGLRAEPSQVVVSCGAKQSLFNALMSVIEPGDEVLVPAPFWATYEDQVAVAGGTVRRIATTSDSGFLPSIEQFKEALGPKTRAIVLNSPNNPTGAVYPRSLLKEIAALAIRHDLWIIADDIYERLVYNEPHQSIAALGSEVADRTITIMGCSKSYAMTGWRIGYAIAPKRVAEAMGALQDQVTSNPTSFAQVGALAALRLDPSVVEAMRCEFLERRDLVLDLLQGIEGFKTPVPGGAFYVMPNVEACLGGRFADDMALAEHLLEHAGVAIIPGSIFGGPGHIRLSYAASRDDLREGIARIARALNAP